LFNVRFVAGVFSLLLLILVLTVGLRVVKALR